MRIDGWDAALAALLDYWAARPFAYGEADCARFVAEAVAAQTGQDFYAPFLGKYKSKSGSVKALRTIGAGDLAATITAALGEPVHPAFAGRGDVVMMDGNAGLCMGAVAWFVGEAGLEQRATAACQTAWKV
jgi:hypothetical protein